MLAPCSHQSVTYVSGESKPRIDYYLVSKKLEDRGLVRADGMLADPVNEADHKPVMLDIDADTSLGKSGLRDDAQKAHKERVTRATGMLSSRLCSWGR